VALPVFQWKRPSDGKVFNWHPLTVSDDLDLSAAYASEAMRPLKNIAAMCLRIYADDTKAKAYDMGELRKWEQSDMFAFVAEVNEKEDARARAHQDPASARGDVIADLSAKVDEFRAHALAASAALEAALAAAKAANVPLGS
jgi:hypothetical protein